MIPRFLRRATVLVTTVASLLAANLLLAAPANAAPANCPSGTTCLWEDPNYLTNGSSARLQWYRYSIANFRNYTYQGTSINLANTVTSVYNNGNTDASFLFTGPNKGGDGFILYVGTGKTQVGSLFNDNLESGYFQSCLPPSVCE
ncbi:hypothetical protein E4U02_14585 [Microbacterium paludicola]|uniref:Peptidase inhibitor family I36 protein n=1 Tax=Microbacterium paludicola TaxID=300019 RepID=A0A4Y9FMK0_9MICO|nr:peptidase inhibitor family I36 protein [Microbacterium paludicola]MBF0817631.1 peptidase inhibitor family I36 protein [Microbacterium paludicola]TFU30465.1 hypothetical protein E4U02_14585 [Microbacterium paludicola]